MVYFLPLYICSNYGLSLGLDVLLLSLGVVFVLTLKYLALDYHVLDYNTIHNS